MPENNTATASPETTTTEQWDRRPVITLIAVIAAWYVGTIGVVLSQIH